MLVRALATFGRDSRDTPCDIQFARRFCLSADVGGYTAITAEATTG